MVAAARGCASECVSSLGTEGALLEMSQPDAPTSNPLHALGLQGLAAALSLRDAPLPELPAEGTRAPPLPAEAAAEADQAVCAVCLERPPTTPFPNPQCRHKYCPECLEAVLRTQLSPACPQCRRPAALSANGASRPPVVREPAEPPEDRWRVLHPAIVRDGPRLTAQELGWLQPGDYVAVLEERCVHGHRRIRIAEGMWASRVTWKGRVLVDAPGPRWSLRRLYALVVGALCALALAELYYRHPIHLARWPE